MFKPYSSPLARRARSDTDSSTRTVDGSPGETSHIGNSRRKRLVSSVIPEGSNYCRILEPIEDITGRIWLRQPCSSAAKCLSKSLDCVPIVLLLTESHDGTAGHSSFRGHRP